MLSGEDIGVLVRATYGCYTASKGFVVVETAKAMDAAVYNLDPVLLLDSALFDQSSHAQPEVSRHGVTYVDKCLRRLEAENMQAAAPADKVNLESLLRALGKGATSSVKGVKQAARDGVQRCCMAWGDDVFHALLSKHSDMQGARAIRDLASTSARQLPKSASAAPAAR
eukprot:g16281.t1